MTVLSAVVVATRLPFGLVAAAPCPPSPPPIDCSEWNTPSFFAVASTEVIADCIAGGADVNAREINGRTPLHNATKVARDPSSILVLISSGSDVAALDDSGHTPLHDAARNNARASVVATLAAAGVDPNARNVGGETPLHQVADTHSWQSPGSPETIVALMTAGADIDAKRRDGLTPLHLATVRPDNYAAVRALLAAGADVRTRDNDGLTPLHSALSLWASTRDDMAGRTPRQIESRAAVVTALLSAGADINAQGNDGMIPLHYAARFCSGQLVEILLAARADPLARDARGYYPSVWACDAFKGGPIHRRLFEETLETKR